MGRGRALEVLLVPTIFPGDLANATDTSIGRYQMLSLMSLSIVSQSDRSFDNE